MQCPPPPPPPQVLSHLLSHPAWPVTTFQVPLKGGSYKEDLVWPLLPYCTTLSPSCHYPMSLPKVRV